jgi:hypothetical protein
MSGSMQVDGPDPQFECAEVILNTEICIIEEVYSISQEDFDCMN